MTVVLAAPPPGCPPGYPLAFPADGVLVDDPRHASDLTAQARGVFGVVFGADADRRWQEAGFGGGERGAGRLGGGGRSEARR